jgi:hypothetical protein
MLNISHLLQRIFRTIACNSERNLFFSKAAVVAILIFASIWKLDAAENKGIRVDIPTDRNILLTTIIQQAIDSCSKSGGGMVFFAKGRFLSGGISLRNNVTLHLENGALITGSDKYSDYSNDAFIYGKDISGVRIEGEGIINGVDCYNPEGEEGFRGPHCIKLINCTGITIQGITIINSANWAVNCRYCSNARITRIKIRGGHDGIHTRFCHNFTVTGCDVRTGDDAFAGNDNRDFLISDCSINSSCNGFRIGCLNFIVRHCRIWGPGEFVHKIQKRNNMLSAFVHFSPKDENPVQVSGNWLIEDVTIENTDNVYVYNFENGLWQTGQPVTDIQFIKLTATGILNSFNVEGDGNRHFSLLIKDSSLSYRDEPADRTIKFEGVEFLSPALFNIDRYHSLELENVRISKSGIRPVFNFGTGDILRIKKMSVISSE